MLSSFLSSLDTPKESHHNRVVSEVATHCEIVAGLPVNFYCEEWANNRREKIHALPPMILPVFEIERTSRLRGVGS